MQYSKAHLPIKVTELGIVTFVNDLHLSNVRSSILVTNGGISISFIWLQPEKAYFPIDLIVEGNEIDVKT